MNPAWKSCRADIFEGQDPPRTLSPAPAMAPAPTLAETKYRNTAASPSPPIPALPHKTVVVDSQPADPVATPDSPSKSNDPSAEDPGDPSNSNNSSKPKDASTDDPGDFSHNQSPPKPVDPTKGGSESDNLQSKPDKPSTADPENPKEPAENAGSPAPSPAADPTHNPATNSLAVSPPSPPAAEPEDTRNTLFAFPTAVALQGHTITQGASPITIAKTPVAYQSGSISVGSEIQAVPTGWGLGNENTSPMTVGGLAFSAIPYGAKVDGNPQTIHSHAANAAQMYDPGANDPNPATYITVGGQTIAVDANAISIAGTTLSPGDPGVTVDGTPISLGPSNFVVGSRTETLSPPQATTTAQLPAITVAGQMITIGSSAIIVDGTTLKPADPGITVGGTVVSLGSSVLVIGSHTEQLILPQAPPTPTPSYLILGGKTIAVAASSIVVAGHTMTPGGPAVLADGTWVSLGSSVLVVGTRTLNFTLPTVSAAAVTSEGIGAIILKGLGGIGAGTVASPTSTAAAYNGTRGGNRTMVFMGGAKHDDILFKGWAAWVWTALLFVFC